MFFILDNDTQTTSPVRNISNDSLSNQSNSSTPDCMPTTSAISENVKVPKGRWVEHFKIPWSKMPKSLISACERNIRPTASDRREFVRILCRSIREHSTFPGRKNLTKIASMVVEKYRASFIDVVGDTVIDSGYESLRKQLEERIFNENRKRATTSCDQLNDQGESSKSPKRKKPVADAYGCVNWQPDTLPDNETNESQREKQLWLISEHHKEVPDKMTVTRFMKETYVSQRHFINRQKPLPPTIQEIKNGWPFLFSKEYLLQHFDELMGFELAEIFQKTVEQKASIIFNFMKEDVPKKKVKDTVRLIENVAMSQDGKATVIAGVWSLLLSYFDEDVDHMIRYFDVSASILTYCTV